MSHSPISQDEINAIIWKSCDTFRGSVDASDYKNYVLTMLFLKYLSDVWQDHYEAYQIKYGDSPALITAMMKTERFVLPESANFYSLHKNRHLPGNGERIDKALHAIEDANSSKLRDVFQDISFNANKLGEEKSKNDLLRHLLEDFAQPGMNLRPSRIGDLDIIGNAYEFLISRFAAGAGKTAGEFYTPPQVSDLLAELLDPQPGEQICDPACGSASLLMKCGRKVLSKTGSRDYALFGQESIGATWALAKMNLFLHGEDNHRVEWGDSIRNPKLLDASGGLMHFDVVTANPPFSLEKWGIEQAERDKFGRFQRGLPPKTKGDYAFILHMIETLKPGTGRMGVVVPHGVLFRGGSEGKIRQALIEENLLDAVIGLPEKLFFGTGIPAAILLFRKAKSGDDVLFIDASRDFVAGKNQNQLGPQQLDRIVHAYRTRQHQPRYAERVELQRIRENDYNLNIPRYVDTFEAEEEIDLLTIKAEREELERELLDLKREMDKYLMELGCGE
ncbi:type I restriction-modification system subunit M [Pseudomonas sediminis]|uniref:type I restriction-modification system subunit M n=1 Tax=Pseudomonas sediminis TaxID=1691904 RepID=UPI00244A8F55|nr:type I restriction-modification system subunit M [Pseudomonas sediminis]MDG9759555.1 type I restriction-modification system subunit M [Pseudomonas sediminis]